MFALHLLEECGVCAPTMTCLRGAVGGFSIPRNYLESQEYHCKYVCLNF